MNFSLSTLLIFVTADNIDLSMMIFFILPAAKPRLCSPAVVIYKDLYIS